MNWGIVIWLALFLAWAVFGVSSACSRSLCRTGLGVLLIALVVIVGARKAEAAEIRVPDSAAMYRRMVESAVSDYWPAGGSSAQLAAQMHQESIWKPKARSRAGAMGVAQFMPATAKWIATAFPRELGQFDPWDPAQAIRGAAIYDRYLYDRVAGATECDRWAFAFASYNGGLGWVNRDKARASATGADPARWFGHVELTADARRAAVNVRENRGYVRRILLVLTPLYVAAGWPGEAVCS